MGSFYYLDREPHDHDYMVSGNGERAQAFMSRHLKAIKASLSIVEETEEAPDLYRIFGG